MNVSANKKLSLAIRGLGSRKLEKQLAPWVWHLCCPWYGATYFIYAKEVDRLKIGHVKGAPKGKPLNVLIDAPEQIAESRRFNMVCGLLDRFNTISCASPVPIELIAVSHGAEFIEKFFHARYKEHRTHGEWFEASPILTDLRTSIEVAKQNSTCLTRQLPELVRLLEEEKLADKEHLAMAKAFAATGSKGTFNKRMQNCVDKGANRQRKLDKNKAKNARELEKTKARLLATDVQRYEMFVKALAEIERR